MLMNEVITSEAVTLGSGVNHKAKISNDATFLMNAVTKIYKQPVFAVIREYICNAWDAHISAGKTDTPIDVEFDFNTGELSVTDYGSGIPVDKIEDIYLTIGGSTKRNDATVTGAWGVGSKVGWAVQDSFTVISRCNGISTAYSMLKSSDKADGFPVAEEVVSVPTDKTGLTVSVLLDAEPSSVVSYITYLANVSGIKINLNHEYLEPAIDWDNVINIAGYEFALVRNSYLTFCSKTNVVKVKVNNNIFPLYGVSSPFVDRLYSYGYSLVWNYKGSNIYPDMSREGIVDSPLVKEECELFLKTIYKSFPTFKQSVDAFITKLKTYDTESINNLLNHLDMLQYTETHILGASTHTLKNITDLEQLKDFLAKAVFGFKAYYPNYNGLEKPSAQLEHWVSKAFEPKQNRFTKQLKQAQIAGLPKTIEKILKYKFKSRTLPFLFLKPCSGRKEKHLIEALRSSGSVNPFMLREVHIYSNKAHTEEAFKHNTPKYRGWDCPIQMTNIDVSKFCILVNLTNKKHLSKIINVFESLGSKVVLHGFKFEGGKFVETYKPKPRVAKVDVVTPIEDETDILGIEDNKHNLVMLVNKTCKSGIFSYNHNPKFINNSVEFNRDAKSTELQMMSLLVGSKVAVCNSITSYNKAVAEGKQTLAQFLMKPLESFDAETLAFYMYLNNRKSSYITIDALKHWKYHNYLNINDIWEGMRSNGLFNVFLKSNLVEALVPSFNKSAYEAARLNHNVMSLALHLIPMKSSEKTLISKVNTLRHREEFIKSYVTKLLAGFSTFLSMLRFKLGDNETRTLVKSSSRDLISLYINKLYGEI